MNEAGCGGDRERLESLARLARQTRLAQSKFFASRSESDLRAARALEKRLDAAVSDVLEPKQMRLFDDKKGAYDW